jgi:4-cresol dehydrogenase (hydroxylating)
MSSNISEAFSAIVGSDNVVTPKSEGFLDRYPDPYNFDPNYATVPPGAVLPANTEEVQALIRVANELGVGLWTVSRGRNLGYGGASPRRATDWVLDLGRMNKIVEINATLGYAVLEPGVSFFQLAEELRATNSPFIPSVPDLGYGSPIGNALERGFGYAAHGEHSKYLCGLEVVLPDGSLLRTGMGADTDSPARYVYKGGFGPELSGLFQQSNLGVVTQAAVWLHPKPETFATCLISVANVDGLAGLVDTVRPLHLEGTIDSVVIVGNALAIVSGVMPRAAIFDGDGPMPLPVIQGVAEKFGLGFWNAKFGLYGDEAIVKAKIARIEKVLATGLPQATLKTTFYPGDVAPEDVHPGDRGQLAIPSGDLLQMAAWRGGVPAHTDFSVVTTAEGPRAQELVDLIRARVNSYGLDHVGGLTLFGRHAIMLSLISFNASDKNEHSLVNNLFSDLIDDANAAGFAPYRAHPAFMDKIADSYDFNDHAHRRFVDTIKDALDPNNILSAGKQGIWGRGAKN